MIRRERPGVYLEQPKSSIQI